MFKKLQDMNKITYQNASLRGIEKICNTTLLLFELYCDRSHSTSLIVSAITIIKLFNGSLFISRKNSIKDEYI